MTVTKLDGYQIKDGALRNVHIASDAAIALTKLAGGATLIKQDGSVPMTADLPMGNQRVTGLAAPSASGDAATKAYVDGLIAGLSTVFDNKSGAAATTLANINLATPGATHDGVTLANGDILFVRVQTAPAQNGRYVYNGASTPLTRAPDSDSWAELPGALFAVEGGTTKGGTLWFCTVAPGGTLNTTSITFLEIGAGAFSNANFVTSEIPAGTMDGVNLAFTLAATPATNSEALYLGGVRLRRGAGHDYTLSGATITLLGTAPVANTNFLADYRV